MYQQKCYVHARVEVGWHEEVRSVSIMSSLPIALAKLLYTISNPLNITTLHQSAHALIDLAGYPSSDAPTTQVRGLVEIGQVISGIHPE